MARVDRTAYDKLLQAEEAVESVVGTHPSPMMNIAYAVMREARRELTPTVWIDDPHFDRQSLKHTYPRCADTCPTRGSWGATGIMPRGHVLVQNRVTGSAWLSHLRED